jgi:hypothetical protein
MSCNTMNLQTISNARGYEELCAYVGNMREDLPVLMTAMCTANRTMDASMVVVVVDDDQDLASQAYIGTRDLAQILIEAIMVAIVGAPLMYDIAGDAC